MIHFNTNALIALPLWIRANHDVVQRIVAGESAAACALAWYEYLLGPLGSAEAGMAHAFLSGRIEPMGEQDASLGAELFNAAGRRRALKTDALIAAAAIRANADFVTVNAQDFQPFVAHGLRLVAAKV